MGLFRRNKNNNKPLLGQILDLVPRWILESCIKKHQSDKGCSKYKTYDQFVALTFGQLNKCYTLSDISTGIGVCQSFINDLGLSQSPARSTMSDGNKKRTWKVYESLYIKLLSHYDSVLKKDNHRTIIQEIKDHSIKLIDSTTISLCLSMFDWAKFRTAKGGIKIHTCFDDALQIPDLINITEAKTHDSKGLGQNVFPKNTIIVEDRAYFDFALMLNRIFAQNIFVTRIKTNTDYTIITELELPFDTDQDILKDEIITLSGKKAIETTINEHNLRLVTVYRAEDNKVIHIITNNLDWTARTIADLYKKRWDIELFFKAMKQNLQIKTFLGTSENAVKSQIYVALISYLLLELINRTIAKKVKTFSNFVEKIRVCLAFYLSIEYVCNQVNEGAKKVIKQNKMLFKPDLFSQ
ncbi:IS4 family transposase [Flavobacterium sandaracinum]|uniref:IS4 family transposase n=3 Tax=Flavobacterium sandaracinum TaxID=2541733 RepID=A0A4R5CGQ6_9FLAO|nr:IS4 family transposase [Flavobacterium sandaracinum]TDD98885.1 IS4 family transposase [Flavobacterium sandaracinum]